MADKTGIVVAIEAATFFIGQSQVRIRQGEAWAAGSPVVKAHPDLFSDDPDRALGADLVKSRRVPTPEVEQKTAAPGEKSNARRL